MNCGSSRTFIPVFLFYRRNTVVLDFVTWLRKYNEKITEQKKKTGFFGIDLYSLQASREEVLKFLEKRDPSSFPITSLISFYRFFAIQVSLLKLVKATVVSNVIRTNRNTVIAQQQNCLVAVRKKHSMS